MKAYFAAALALPAASAYTGRCHVYGGLQPATACGYVTTKEETDPAHPNFVRCGMTPKTACLSTMDGITWGNPRCGDCYKVTIHMPDDPDEAHCNNGMCKGYDRSVYIKTLDGSYSDAEFEMSQIAWDTLCPNLCHSNPHENCVMDYNECKYGLYDDSDYKHADGQTFKVNASCYASSHPVTYEKVDCDSDERIVQPDPVLPGGPTTTSTAPATTKTTTAAATTKTTTPAATTKPTTAPAPTTKSVPAPEKPTKSVPAPEKPTTKPSSEKPTEGNACFVSEDWWNVDCMAATHCKSAAEFKNEADCMASNKPNPIWADGDAACRKALGPSACDPNTIGGGEEGYSCYTSEVWWMADCHAAELCQKNEAFASAALCKHSEEANPIWADSQDACRRMLKDAKMCEKL